MNNVSSILIYKSNRKNSITSDFIYINELISKENLTDDRILNQLIGTIDKIVYQSLQFNKNLYISAYVSIAKQLEYVNIDDEIFEEAKLVSFNFAKRKYSSIENLINFIHSIYMLIYPDSKLHLKTIHNNASIKYLINQYYHN